MKITTKSIKDSGLSVKELASILKLNVSGLYNRIEGVVRWNACEKILARIEMKKAKNKYLEGIK